MVSFFHFNLLKKTNPCNGVRSYNNAFLKSSVSSPGGSSHPSLDSFIRAVIDAKCDG